MTHVFFHSSLADSTFYIIIIIIYIFKTSENTLRENPHLQGAEIQMYNKKRHN